MRVETDQPGIIVDWSGKYIMVVYIRTVPANMGSINWIPGILLAVESTWIGDELAMGEEDWEKGTK